MIKKYELIPERSMFRIKALSSFRDVDEGDLGGLIQGEHNLSHNDECWVYRDAQVYENARVYGNAYVSGNALVYGNAQVYGNARVSGYVKVFGNAKVGSTNYIYIKGNVHIFWDAVIDYSCYGNEHIFR